MAGTAVVIFHQARRGVGVQMVDDFLVADVDLPAFDQRRHRYHHGKLFGIAFEIIDHGNHGLVVLARQHDLRRFVEDLGVGLGHVEAAECIRGSPVKRTG